MQVYIYLQDMLLGFSLQVACFFEREEQTQENEHASKQSVARLQTAKSYRTSKVASIPPVHSLRRTHAYNKFARYCDLKVRQI
jgi:hypothetical protein